MTADPELTISYALTYALCGWPVFPCNPGGKEPATRHGFHDATTDPDLIKKWWRHFPTANLAIATGLPGPDVLDVDDHGLAGNGFAAYRTLREASLLGGAGTVITTPSGGMHMYFRGSGQSSGRLPQHHIDFKSRGGYILAPPSQINGTPYLILARNAASGGINWPAAARLLTPEPSRAIQPDRAIIADGHRLSAWVGQLREGNRNAGLFWAACRALEAGQPAILDDLAAAAASVGLDHREVARTMASARRASQRHHELPAAREASR